MYRGVQGSESVTGEGKHTQRSVCETCWGVGDEGGEEETEKSGGRMKKVGDAGLQRG